MAPGAYHAHFFTLSPLSSVFPQWIFVARIYWIEKNSRDTRYEEAWHRRYVLWPFSSISLSSPALLNFALCLSALLRYHFSHSLCAFLSFHQMLTYYIVRCTVYSAFVLVEWKIVSIVIADAVPPRIRHAEPTKLTCIEWKAHCQWSDTNDTIYTKRRHKSHSVVFVRCASYVMYVSIVAVQCTALHLNTKLNKTFKGQNGNADCRDGLCLSVYTFCSDGNETNEAIAFASEHKRKVSTLCLHEPASERLFHPFLWI